MGRIFQILKGLTPLLLAFLLFACGGQGGGTEVGNPPSPSQSPGEENPPPAAPSGENPSSTPEECENPHIHLNRKSDCPLRTNPFDVRPSDTRPVELQIQNDTQSPVAPEEDSELQS